MPPCVICEAGQVTPGVRTILAQTQTKGWFFSLSVAELVGGASCGASFDFSLARDADTSPRATRGMWKCNEACDICRCLQVCFTKQNSLLAWCLASLTALCNSTTSTNSSHLYNTWCWFRWQQSQIRIYIGWVNAVLYIFLGAKAGTYTDKTELSKDMCHGILCFIYRYEGFNFCYCWAMLTQHGGIRRGPAGNLSSKQNVCWKLQAWTRPRNVRAYCQKFAAYKCHLGCHSGSVLCNHKSSIYRALDAYLIVSTIYVF